MTHNLKKKCYSNTDIQASMSMQFWWFISLRSKRFRGAKSEEETGVLAFCPREKWGESKNKKEGAGGRGKKETACSQALRFSNISFACERSSWLAGLVEHVSIKGPWSSECWKERSKFVYKKRLTFLTKRVFGRELQQYGRNPVVQCRGFGISKPDYYCRWNCDTICSCSFNFKITFLNATWAKGKINKPRDRKFALLRGKTEWFRLACFMACFRILSCRYSDISLEAFLLREFWTSGYNSEWFIIVSCGMPFLLHICLTKHLVFSSTRVMH